MRTGAPLAQLARAHTLRNGLMDDKEIQHGSPSGMPTCALAIARHHDATIEPLDPATGFQLAGINIPITHGNKGPVKGRQHLPQPDKSSPIVPLHSA
eukprot:14259766-Alexandrium_andersonii.AAC.1